jgi:hypothetical protein
MNQTTTKNPLVLAVHPTTCGFGWALFEGPLSPYDWGIASVRAGRNERLLKRFGRLLSRHHPSVVVFEEFEHAGKADRIKSLCREMVHMARLHRADVAVYPQEAIRAGFQAIGANTRFEIAEVIARRIPMFAHRLPKKRKAWSSQDWRQCLFDAAAVAVTHFSLRG